MTAALEDRIRGDLASSLAWDIRRVRPGNDNSPEPAEEPHASLLLVEETPRGYAVINAGDPSQTTMQMRSEFSLQFYGAGAYGAARLFRLWAQSEAGLEAAEAGRYRLVQPFGLRRLDAIDDDGWEERAVIDLSVDWVDSGDADVDTIATRAGDIIVSTPSADYEEAIQHG